MAVPDAELLQQVGIVFVVIQSMLLRYSCSDYGNIFLKMSSGIFRPSITMCY